MARTHIPSRRHRRRRKPTRARQMWMLLVRLRRRRMEAPLDVLQLPTFNNTHYLFAPAGRLASPCDVASSVTRRPSNMSPECLRMLKRMAAPEFEDGWVARAVRQTTHRQGFARRGKTHRILLSVIEAPQLPLAVFNRPNPSTVVTTTSHSVSTPDRLLIAVTCRALTYFL